MIPHKKYMEVALQLAEKGRGHTSPHPMTGCVIVKRGKVIGRGYRKSAVSEYAEVEALRKAGEKARNATMYVTMEPHSQWTNSPPCTEDIVRAGIREVVVGLKDPSPDVQGIRELKGRGLKTKVGILEPEIRKQNESYVKFAKQKIPYVIIKVAMTADGNIATRTGDSKYITSKKAREFVHELRAKVDAVLVGVNTVRRDDPLLTVRLVKGPEPMKVVVDSSLSISQSCKLFKHPKKLIVVTTRKASPKKMETLKKKGVTIVVARSKQGRVDMKDCMRQLAKLDIVSVLIEGGAQVNATALKEKFVDKMYIFAAPKLIGLGHEAVGNLGITKIKKAITFKDQNVTKIGKDILIEAYL